MTKALITGADGFIGSHPHCHRITMGVGVVFYLAALVVGRLSDFEQANRSFEEGRAGNI